MRMARHQRPSLVAVLGPANTGKTHLAIERMLSHGSGIIGLPLRLLAHEVYDRLARMKGAELVALVTGEERIWPDTARYIIATTEAMPLGAKVFDDRCPAEPTAPAFVAVDEVQLAQDRERGHVFTSRLLHARGREETMMLGSATMTPIVRQLLPDAQITSRPRFSTLSYLGPEKLANLPKRSVIVAFSADEVYSIAEGLRRISGGAAIVMGALSPQTRNAQVAMFQSGEVDYLVATDAIGMGLNLDTDHVVFASLHKFDGVEQRRLTVSEMAQIAGRAGRHQRGGSFGTLSGRSLFSADEVEAIEEHRFDPLGWIYWREPDLAMDSVDALIADLEKAPARSLLRSAPPASDISVLRQLHSDGNVTAAADTPAMVHRLWECCSLPDFRGVGAKTHGQMVNHIWTSLSSAGGHIDADWFLGKLAALDRMDGPIEALGDRLAAVRSYCYIAQRADWMADPAPMAEKAQHVETRLSDAMHDALTARFVDRRIALLMRALGQDTPPLMIDIDEAGTVRADGQIIGTLDGFTFRVDPAASAAEHKMLLATVDKYLGVELARRAAYMAGLHEGNFSLAARPGQVPTIMWHDHVIATLTRGKHLLSPRVVLDRSLSVLDANVVAAVQSRIDAVVDGCIGRYLRPLIAMAARAKAGATPSDERAILAALVDGCGVVDRDEFRDTVKHLTCECRMMLKDIGVHLGYLDLFVPTVLKPMPLHWLNGLAAAWRSTDPGGQITAGKVMTPLYDAPYDEVLGFRMVGDMWVRVDAVDKMARHAFASRDGRPSILKKKRRDKAVDAAADSPGTVDVARTPDAAAPPPP
ncbi:MAG: helicase-related protein, partial [Sphingopyxis sp.]